jgi:hypothetical protein
VQQKKMAVFWFVAPCSLVEVYRRFRGAYCLHHECSIALMMEAASTSEMSVNFYQTTRCNKPEESHLHTRRRENLKSLLMQQNFSYAPDLRGSSKPLGYEFNNTYPNTIPDMTKL